MKTNTLLLVMIAALASSFSAQAGTTECHQPIITQRQVINHTKASLISVAAVHSNSGCASSLKVTLKFNSGSIVNWAKFGYMAIRAPLARSPQFPFLLDPTRFEVVGQNTVVINNQLILRDTLFVNIPGFPLFSFEIL